MVENQEDGEAPMSDTPTVTPPAELPPAVMTAPPIPAAGGSAPSIAPGQVMLPMPSDTSGWDQSGGQLSGAESLQLEVDILSADAVDRIADAIAERVAAKATTAKIRSVTVISPAMLAALRLHCALDAEVRSLQAMAEQLVPAAAPTSVETTDASAFSDLPFKAVDTAQRVLKSASSALSVFASTTAYAGKKDNARQNVLDAALAKHLAARRLQVELPEHALPVVDPNGLFARILDLRARCGELQRQGADLEALLEVSGAVDGLLKLAFGTDTPATGTPLAQQLMLADGIAQGLTTGRAVLLVEIAFSGGSYRMRKWIFNTLFGRDGLTYGGGAGVTYFLFRADDRSTLDSDTLYFTSPHGRFHHGGSQQFEPTNLNR
jgi:23S rRNA U2552 (ribose-2'-O)-methylase RlmE/FtsJ